MDGGRRGQPHGFADLAHRGGVALLPKAVADELEDLESLPGQCLGHVALLVPIPLSALSSPAPPRGEHQFVSPSSPWGAGSNTCSSRGLCAGTEPLSHPRETVSTWTWPPPAGGLLTPLTRTPVRGVMAG